MKNLLVIVCLILLISPTVLSVPTYYENEIPIIPSTKQFSVGVAFLSYEKFTVQTERQYFIYEGRILGKYIPNKSVELGFQIPYLVMSDANDYGALGDIKIFSKFVLYTDLLYFIDTIYFNNSLVINISLASGLKKEDSYRNIGLDKGLYYPISAGYSDIDIGVNSGFVLTYFSFFISAIFVSSSSKIEPPLAFDTKNDYFKVGMTSEIFVLTQRNFSLKLFSELLSIIPISDESKYINSNMLGFGIWTKIVDSVIIKAGYYYNVNPKVISEKYIGSALSTSLEYRF
jgi:hypothetical protein